MRRRMERSIRRTPSDVMKITLNSSVPAAQRPRAGQLVREVVPDAEVEWADSRFPRLVILVSPASVSTAKPRAGSMFADADRTTMSPGALTDLLEQRLRRLKEES